MSDQGTGVYSDLFPYLAFEIRVIGSTTVNQLVPIYILLLTSYDTCDHRYFHFHFPFPRTCVLLVAMHVWCNFY